MFAVTKTLRDMAMRSDITVTVSQAVSKGQDDGPGPFPFCHYVHSCDFNVAE